MTKLSLSFAVTGIAAFTALQATAGDVKTPPEAPRPTLSEELQARGSYIFRFSDDVPASMIPSRAAALTQAVGGELRHSYTKAFRGFAARMPSTAVPKMLKLTDQIVRVQRDGLVHILGQPSGVGRGKPTKDPGTTVGSDPTICPSDQKALSSELTAAWGVARIGADTAWIKGKLCGLGVDVYVLDTGIDLDHPDLTPIESFVDCTSSGCPQGGDDKNGHGTHVAGTIAARANGNDVVGVAPGATLHAVKVLGNSGMGYDSDIIAGIEWVMKNKPNKPVVVNMSLGGSGEKAGSCSNGGSTILDPLYDAFCSAANVGVIFVVAAGNDGADAELHVPSAYDDAVIAVSATDASDAWPYWSNWGDGDKTDSWDTAHYPKQAPVAIAAPGVYIKSTRKGGGTTTMSGTSMATPHVAGAVALYLGTRLDPSNPLASDYSAFVAARAAVMSDSTALQDTTSLPMHREDIVDACKLVLGKDNSECATRSW